MPAELGAAPIQGLRADPEARHPDMRSLAGILDTALEDGPSNARTSPLVGERSVAWPVAIGAALLVAAIVLAFALAGS